MPGPDCWGVTDLNGDAERTLSDVYLGDGSIARRRNKFIDDRAGMDAIERGYRGRDLGRRDQSSSARLV